MNATRRDLEIQFRRVIANGWLSLFQEQARRAGTTTAHELALGSRETNLKNIRGDYRNGRYNGFGILQIDVGTDPAYCERWTPANVADGIIGGTKIYLAKVADTKACVGKKVMVRNRSFTGKAVDADDLRRIATAAYNCGRWAHYHFSRGEHVDSTTTGHDYSRDVYDRAVEFADILQKQGLEVNAVSTELALQGKYARNEHYDRFDLGRNPGRVKLPAGEPQESQDTLAAVDYERDSDGDPFSISDDEILDLTNSISEAPATPIGAPAGALAVTAAGDPAHGAAEPGAGASSGLSESPAPPAETTISEKVESEDGMRSVEATVTTPAGDAPNVEPSHWFSVEDWKPWAKRWAGRVWSGVSGLTIPAGGGFGFAALNAGENWWMYAIAGGVIILLVAGVGILATLVIVGIWLWQNRHIPEIKAQQMRILADPNMKNVGLNFEKK